jgi:hypothetical protein
MAKQGAVINSTAHAASVTNSAQSQTAPSAQLPQTTVSTPMGTLNIALAQAPQPLVPFLNNPSNLLPLAAFFGVVLTIIFGWKKMRTELAASANEATKERNQSRDEASLDRKHDAEQAHQERITTARREVYLELISEMTKAQFALALLPMQNIEKLDFHAGFGGLITATSKISILGEMPTVAMSRELLTAIQEALFRVLVLLPPLNEHRDAGKLHDEKLAMHQLEIDQLNIQVRDFYDRKISSLESAQVQKRLNWHHAEAVKHSTSAAQAKSEFAEEHKKYAVAVLEETKVITRKVDDLICSIRSELNLSTSLEELHASSASMQSAAEAASKQFYARLEPLTKPA